MMVDDKCNVPFQNGCSKHCLLIVLLIILLTACSSSESDSLNSKKVFAKIGGSPSASSGYVEVSFDGDTWAKLGPENDDWEVGHVVCRQLGFGPPSYASSVFLSNKEPRVIVSCDGHEMTLSDCEVKTNSSFYSVMALKVSCLPASSTELDVALATDYTFMDSGVVLSFVDGRWGPICASAYRDRKVCAAICKQLGYTHCDIYPSITNFGVEILEMPVISTLDCYTHAKSLGDCRFRRLQNQTCNYPEDKYLQVSCTIHGQYGGGYDLDFDSSADPYYSVPSNDEVEFDFTGKGQFLAYLAIPLTVVLCITLYMCHKRSLQNTLTLEPVERSTGSSPSSSLSLLPPTPTPARTPQGETGSSHPHQSHLMHHPQSDGSPGYPVMPPPAYATSDPESSTLLQDVPPQIDPDLPTYEEVTASKIDTEDV